MGIGVSMLATNTGPLLVSTAGFATEVDTDIITKKKTKEKARIFRIPLPSQCMS